MVSKELEKKQGGEINEQKWRKFKTQKCMQKSGKLKPVWGQDNNKTLWESPQSAVSWLEGNTGHGGTFSPVVLPFLGISSLERPS